MNMALGPVPTALSDSDAKNGWKNFAKEFLAMPANAKAIANAQFERNLRPPFDLLPKDYDGRRYVKRFGLLHFCLSNQGTYFFLWTYIWAYIWNLIYI